MNPSLKNYFCLNFDFLSCLLLDFSSSLRKRRTTVKPASTKMPKNVPTQQSKLMLLFVVTCQYACQPLPASPTHVLSLSCPGN